MEEEKDWLLLQEFKSMDFVLRRCTKHNEYRINPVRINKAKASISRECTQMIINLMLFPVPREDEMLPVRWLDLVTLEGTQKGGGSARYCKWKYPSLNNRCAT
ncbi:uncharacterized protein LOC129968198 [Argiope bruennichi]|uniref:uncharacterized protein LOC129968198 n=1 Tax=Argiope bruennichi TaxID=94029 RepID=UPI0024956B15|nr:uncharacterized protein LOC129968198 [Argiope bruennichi]